MGKREGDVPSKPMSRRRRKQSLEQIQRRRNTAEEARVKPWTAIPTWPCFIARAEPPKHDRFCL
jgi:hypothetical protein